MTVQVQLADGDFRIGGDWDGGVPANAFRGHLRARAFSPATVRAYAFDMVNLARFLTGRGLALAAVTPVDVFSWVDWQGVRRDDATGQGRVVPLRRQAAAASTVNRRVAAVRAFFEYLVMTGARSGNPVPSPRRGQGIGGAWPARSLGAGPSARWRPAGAPASPSA